MNYKFCSGLQQRISPGVYLISLS